MIDAVSWLFSHIGLGFYHIFYAVTHPGLWLDWSNNENLLRFVYYGGSVEFFFALFDIFLVLTVLGLVFRQFIIAASRNIALQRGDNRRDAPQGQPFAQKHRRAERDVDR